MEKGDPSVRLYVPLPIEDLRDSLQNKKVHSFLQDMLIAAISKNIVQEKKASK
ncbi:hypothetical protein HMPREF0983_00161 [Erysipelotrichaceae bacterium 3_1_53]|nr:hypothetical protein HMPREF0983_00161 [Erysipelotrichaceae bacterium 3_1_53]